MIPSATRASLAKLSAERAQAVVFSRPMATSPSGRGQRHHKRRKVASPLDDFFATYHPKFKYDATRSASLEFYRLSNEFNWDKNDPVGKNAHRDFKDALVKQFNRLYGTDENDLARWQNLCYMVRIEPIPDKLNACREAVRETHVNLVDLVDTNTTGEEVQVFDTERDLSDYTKCTGKFFPKKNAYAGGLLRYLLRHILNPATEVPRRRRHNGRR